MRALILAVVTTLALIAAPATAQERVTLGLGRLFTNDALGDGQDRWQTGGYVASWMRGGAGTVSLPERFGELMEYRFSTRIIAPEDLSTPAPGDRRYAGIMSFGAYTHFTRGGFDFTAGSEVVVVGPATGLDAFQADVHDIFGIAGPSAAVRGAQIGTALYPALSFEVARPIALDVGGVGGAVLRPFVQMRGGDETYARIGADLLFGPNFTSGVLARDETTGLVYQTIGRVPGQGLSFLLGADTAKVLSSAWLPASGGYTLTPMRNRVRAGMSWQGETVGLFYGATWLGPEFSAQPAGQVVGSMQMRIRF
jgi:Outer membrane protein LpxR